MIAQTDPPPQPVRTIVAFDFDGTLSRRDTLLPFLRRVCGTPAVAAALMVTLPRLLATAVGGDRDLAKAVLLRRLLTGREVAGLCAEGLSFADHVLANRLRREARTMIERHAALGHGLVMVSAGLDVYLEHVGRALGFDAVLATRLAVGDDGRLTGELDGANVRGPEKARLLRAYLGEGKVVLHAYGDSHGDAEMLAMATYPSRRRRSRPRSPIRRRGAPSGKGR